MHDARLVIQIPKSLKVRLDAERKRGITAAGLIPYLLEWSFCPVRIRCWG